MDLPWGSVESKSFVTPVGLITSKGDKGDNIMAAESTHHLSYSPGIISVSIGNNKTTANNISATKFFGVSLASENQQTLVSFAGGHSGDKIDKIAALKEIGFGFTRGKETGVYLVDGAVLQAECKLVNHIVTGWRPHSVHWRSCFCQVCRR